MFFEDEPEWMRKARTVPVRSTWESRQPYKHTLPNKPPVPKQNV